MGVNNQKEERIILKIVCFTGSRAEYYLLRPLFNEINKKYNFDLQLIVSGGILREKNKQTLKDIEQDNIKILAKIETEMSNNNHSASIGKLCIEIIPYLNSLNADLGIVYADRYESFGFAIAASHSDIPLLHLEAGDITEGGTYDDQIRHCISKLSHLFCTSTKKGCKVINNLGEEKWRCIHTGLISYDDMKNVTDSDRENVINDLKLGYNCSIVLSTFHPIPRDLELTKKETIEFLEGLRIFSENNESKIIITAPNNDLGKDIIFKLIDEYLPKIKNAIYVESLGGKRYHSIMSLSIKRKVIVCGNSSSVIKEAPYYGAHSLNIGIRQSGREISSTQTDCIAERKSISILLRKLSKKNCKIGINPYYKENSSKSIISFIENIFKNKSSKEILFKKWSVTN